MAKFQEIESAVVSLDKQVKQLATDLQSLINAVNSNSKSQVDLANKTKAVTTATSQISAVEKELENIRKRSLKVTKETITAKENLRKRTKELTDQVRKEQGAFKKSGGLFRSMTKSILATGAAFLSLRAAFTVVKNGLKTIIGFEKGMSSVKAITNATAKEFKALQSNALKLGGTTAKTAIEVAGLQKEFAKLGFSTSEILAATEATINLSIAAESDLAEAATVAASTIRGFGLSATESTRVTDVMAKSFTTTGLNLEKFKVSMANAQVAAKSTGRSLEFTAAALGTIIDTGTDASKAGTDLRNIFGELAKQGLTLDQAYAKVNGSSNKVVTAMQLVGKRAFSSLITLAENTEKVDGLTEAYKNSAGAAKEMADIMADNLAGDIVLASSAWDGFVLSINSGSGRLSKTLRGIISTFTNLLNIITKLNDGESLRVQKLKEEIGYEDRINKIKEKSIKIIDKRSQSENKSKVEVAQGLLTELKLRSELANTNLNELNISRELAKGNEHRARTGKELIKGATEDQIAKAKVDADIKRESVIILENILAAELDAEKAKQDAAEETARVKKQIEEDAATEKVKKSDKKNNKELLKNAKEFQDKLKNEAALTADEFSNITISITDEIENEIENQLRNENLAVEEAMQANIDARAKASARAIEIESQKEEAIKDLKIAAIDSANKIVSDRVNFSLDNDLAAFQAAQDAEQKALEVKLQNKEISEEEFTKKSKALESRSRIESAKAEKKKAAYSNIIDTITAVAKTFAELGWPAGIIPAGVMAGIGVANGIAIAAEPIPKFKHGTNGQLQLDTTAIVGDGSGDSRELIKLPDGREVITPATDTKVHLPKGSQVFSHNSPETQAALNGGMTQEMYQGLINEQRLTRKAISNQPKSVTSLTDKGLQKAYITKQRKINLLDEYIRS